MPRWKPPVVEEVEPAVPATADFPGAGKLPLLAQWHRLPPSTSSALARAGPAFTVRYGALRGPIDEAFAKATCTWQLFAAAAARHPERDCLGWYASQDCSFLWRSYQQVKQTAEQVASGLAACSWQPGSCCALLAANSKAYSTALLVRLFVELPAQVALLGLS